MAPLWCDLGCCSQTVVAIKLLQTSTFYIIEDLPLPEPGAKGGISVQKSAEVSFTNI